MIPGTALLLIDTQVGLLSGAESVYEAERVLACSAMLAERARAHGTPVIHVQDNDVGEGVGSPGWQIHPAIAPAPGDLVLRKAWADSFYETELHAELSARGIKRLVIAGLKSDVCVMMTCMRAITLGYDVALAADAHSTTDNHIISAPQASAYMNELLDGFGFNDGFGSGRHTITVAPAAAIEL